MSAESSLEQIATSLLAQRDLELISCDSIQSLWAGYGHICQIEATPRRGISATQSAPRKPVSLILKSISPPSTAALHDEGHVRKILSYQVEQHFYAHLADQLPESVAVAECIGSMNNGRVTAIMLKDLRASSQGNLKPKMAFPVSLERRGHLDADQVYAALDWLASFHGHFWNKTGKLIRGKLLRPPLVEAERQRQSGGAHGTSSSGHFNVESVWLNGGYTYLATRQREFAKLAGDCRSTWSESLCTRSASDGRSLAEQVADILQPLPESGLRGPISEYETLIHGDVKSENMFASTSGREVAFVDFQYVGLGLGVSDVAKLFTCSVPGSMLVVDDDGGMVQAGLPMQKGEMQLLLHYIRKLEATSNRQYPWEELVRHWEIALVDWLRFQASWGFWGNTKWLEARVKHILQDDRFKEWLKYVNCEVVE
ncbi:hypothetical protein BJ170DRAFT_465980 [Xylariales sp. AK1849]|nr:hypothetical protein BJ170DRAFT_465980 [Xylariales sp. AK1849]